MTYFKDFREHLSALEAAHKLVRITDRVNKDTQLHPLVRLQFRGLKEEERKGFLFENVVDSRGREYPIPVAIGTLAGSSEIYAIGMQCPPGEISEKLARAEMNPIPPRIVRDGPVHEEVHTQGGLLEHGGLDEFPIPVSTPGYDVAPYFTASCWVTKDPDTGIRNVGTYRAQLKSAVRTGVYWGPRVQGGLVHWQKCRERGIPLQAAIVIGGPPSVAYVSVAKPPRDVDEFTIAGGIAGEPLELVKCRTVDLEVPASAEVVIEGEVATTELEPEAPFGEALGFVGMNEMMPYFTVKCITHRRDPVWVAIISQYPPSESSKIRQHPNEGTVYKYLLHTLNMSHVLAVAFYDNVGASRLMVIQVKKVAPDEVWRTLEAAGSRFLQSKLIIAVDEDVDPHDMDAVLLAVCMRTQPHRDTRIVRYPSITLSDRSLEPPEEFHEKRDGRHSEVAEGSYLLINAVMRWPYPPLSLPGREFMEDARRLWTHLGLPELNLKEPWYGRDLGYWSRENDEAATMATRGEYYRTGEEQARRRKRI